MAQQTSLNDPQTFLDNLNKQLECGEFEQVDSMINNFVPTAFTEADVRQTLNLLRKKRQFESLEKAASLFIAQDFQLPFVRRQFSQALIDQGRLDQGIAALTFIGQNINPNDPEQPEILGLLGRAQKQQFVSTGEPEYLRHAIDAYKQGWNARQGDYRWHGINLVALLERAEREHISGVDYSQSADIASNILEEINNLENPQVWDYGTAMEANLALNDRKATLAWAKKYVRHPYADAFELGSSLRQLREIWQTKDNGIANALEPVLEFELLQRQGGAVSIAPNDVPDTSGFEAIYGSESFVRIEWLKGMIKRLASVARVCHKTTGEPFGTAFLIKASDLNSNWGEALAIVTNSHVVSDEPSDEAPLRPDLACAEFTQLPGKPKINLGQKRFHSRRFELDAWICDVEAPNDVQPLDLSFYHPTIPGEHDKPQRIYVIGHPKGGDLAVSLFNNDLIGYDFPYVHYTSPTEGGSSGSPVLTRDLQTFALHHKTRRSLRANEGILLDQIRDQVCYK